MSINFLKSMCAFLLSVVLVACTTTQGVTTDEGLTIAQATETNEHAGSINISHDEDASASYVISGKVYQWDHLSDEQRTKLSVLNKKISYIENQLAQFEGKLEPLIDEIEKEAEKIENLAEILEVELGALEDIDNMTIKQVHEISSAIQKKVRVHEKEIHLHEVTIHKKEAKIHALEREFLGKELESVKQLESYADEVVEILTNG